MKIKITDSHRLKNFISLPAAQMKLNNAKNNKNSGLNLEFHTHTKSRLAPIQFVLHFCETKISYVS